MSTPIIICLIAVGLLAFILVSRKIWSNMDDQTKCDMNNLYCGENFTPVDKELEDSGK